MFGLSSSNTFPVIVDVPTFEIVEELSEERLQKVQKYMYPGKYSNSGFLTEDQKLYDVYEKDKQTLKSRKVTYDQIVDVLESLMDKVNQLEAAERTFGKDKLPLIEGKYLVETLETKAWQICPFTLKSEMQQGRDCANRAGSVDYRVTRIDNKDVLTFTSLLPHMIRHHFFEGGRYRISPTRLIDFFNIKSGVFYTPEYEVTHKWTRIGGSCFSIPQEDIEDAENIYSDKYRLAEGVTGYTIPGRKSLSSSTSTRLLRNLDRDSKYLFLACNTSFDFSRMPQWIEKSLLCDFVSAGTSLFQLEEEKKITCGSEDKMIPIERAVFFNDGTFIKMNKTS